MKEKETTMHAGKLWLIIGAAIAILGLLFTIAMSVAFNSNIDRLTTSCERDGGQAVVSKQQFLFLTTGYSFECDK